MALTRISGNQIADTTSAIITTLSFLNTTSVFRIPSGNTDDRPAGPSVGTLRFNTELDSAEIYKADDGTGNPGWTSVGGGGPSLGDKSVIRTNDNNISENITIGSSAGDEFTNGMSAGPITIDNTYIVTIESGSSWTVV